MRVDRYYAQRIRGIDPVSMGRLLWLVEQPNGLACSQVRWIDDRQIVLLPSRPALGNAGRSVYRPKRGSSVLVETDIRPLQHVKLQPRAGPMNLEHVLPAAAQAEERMRFSDLLRISRGRAGLTFRAAHQLTRAIAQILGNREYGIALGMLSDYEAMGGLPRHIAKIVSLCVVYCMDVRELMESAGVLIRRFREIAFPCARWPSARSQSEFLRSCARLRGERHRDRLRPFGRRSQPKKITRPESPHSLSLPTHIGNQGLVTYQSEDRTLSACDSRVLTPAHTDPTMRLHGSPPLPAILSHDSSVSGFRRTWRQMEAGPGNEGLSQNEDFAPHARTGIAEPAASACLK